MPQLIRPKWSGLAACGAAVALLLAAARAPARPLDEEGEINLGLRTYTAVRIGTEQTDAQVISDGVRQVARNVTFPISSAGHLRQHRVFVELDLRHDLTRLVREDWGPFALLNKLPFEIRNLRYYVAYRGEYEGIYDYGPSEFRTAEQFLDPTIVVDSPFPQSPSKTTIANQDRTRLRDIGTIRNRLFQAYVQTKVGTVTARVGRQILAWGETDIFRLLDNINPLDASFGGFLVSLDERRVPLDMVRLTWYLGDFSRTGIPGLSLLSKLPWYGAYVEGFAAIDDAVGFDPGVPKGSPWGPPNVNVPTETILTDIFAPSRSLDDTRGGVQFRFNAPFPGIGDVSLGAAHYYTYFDIPAVRVMSQNFPTPITEPGPATNYSIWAQQTAPRVQVSGLFGNFAMPPEWVRWLGVSGEPIFRFEVAYFRDEPRNSQLSLDPFAFALFDCPGGFRADAAGNEVEDGPYCTAGARTGNSWNAVVGLDLQQWFRFLNPSSSFFITTQFFYRHLQNAEPRELLSLETLPLPDDPNIQRNFFGFLPGQKPIYTGEVLPVQQQVISSDLHLGPIANTTDAAVPNFAHSPVDQYLQTLLITTPFYGGRVLPSLGVFYDWSNAWVVQPSLTYSADPFRFTVTYNFLSATGLKGGQGISLLRDRDNILFQFEYVI